MLRSMAIRMLERERVCVCVCVRERERERWLAFDTDTPFTINIQCVNIALWNLSGFEIDLKSHSCTLPPSCQLPQPE